MTATGLPPTVDVGVPRPTPLDPDWRASSPSSALTAGGDSLGPLGATSIMGNTVAISATASSSSEELSRGQVSAVKLTHQPSRRVSTRVGPVAPQLVETSNAGAGGCSDANEPESIASRTTCSSFISISPRAASNRSPKRTKRPRAKRACIPVSDRAHASRSRNTSYVAFAWRRPSATELSGKTVDTYLHSTAHGDKTKPDSPLRFQDKLTASKSARLIVPPLVGEGVRRLVKESTGSSTVHHRRPFASPVVHAFLASLSAPTAPRTPTAGFSRSHRFTDGKAYLRELSESG